MLLQYHRKLILPANLCYCITTEHALSHHFLVVWSCFYGFIFTIILDWSSFLFCHQKPSYSNINKKTIYKFTEPEVCKLLRSPGVDSKESIPASLW